MSRLTYQKTVWAFGVMVSVSVLIWSIGRSSRAPIAPAPPTLPRVTPVPEGHWDLWLDHSTNGEWEVYLSPLVTTAVITSTTSGISFKDDLQVGAYNTVASWFPDNSAFIVFDANLGCEKCSFDRLTVYLINKESKSVSHFQFEPVTEWTERYGAFWHRIAWSLDGQQFAVIVGGRTIYILDRNANVQRELMPSLGQDDIIDHVIWTRSGLAYTVRTLHPDPQVTEIRIINLAEQSPAETVLRREGDYPYFLSADPLDDYLLIRHGPLGPPVDEIGMFSLKTHQFVQTIYPIEGSYPYFTSLEGDNGKILGLLLLNKGKDLYVFDWKTQTLSDTQVTADKLLGWRDDVKAFITLRSNGPEGKDSWIELVSP